MIQMREIKKLCIYDYIDNAAKTHQALIDYYNEQKWPIDAFNLTGIRFTEDQGRDWYNDPLIAWTWDKIIPVIGTTDPGRYYAKNNLPGTKGVAHIESGLHRSCYALGFHNYSKPQFKHEAFVQVGPMRYFVDVNGDFGYDDTVDFKGNGVIATNYHADVYGKRNDGLIGYASAGCQVVQDVEDLKRQIALFKSTDMYRMNKAAKINYAIIDADQINLGGKA